MLGELLLSKDVAVLTVSHMMISKLCVMQRQREMPHMRSTVKAQISCHTLATCYNNCHQW